MNMQQLALAVRIAKENPGSAGKLFLKVPEGTMHGEPFQQDVLTSKARALSTVEYLAKYDVSKLIGTASPALAVAGLRYEAWRTSDQYISGGHALSGLYTATLRFFFEETQRELDDLLRFLEVTSLEDLDTEKHIRYPAVHGA